MIYYKQCIALLAAIITLLSILRDTPDSLSLIAVESLTSPVKKIFKAASSFISQGFDSSKSEAATSNTIKVEWQSTLEKQQ